MGFSQRALFEGWRSVNNSPDDYASHRFLADAYQNQSSQFGYDAARTSELLQSQLMQPLNMTPVQPSLSEQNLLILRGTGPSQQSFNEFNPLFNRNGFALQTSAMAGNFNTFGDEVTQSGILNKFSYSLGQLHYQTDGYRPNNDLKQNLYNAFFQLSVTPSLSLQAEFRHKYLNEGDLSQQALPQNTNNNTGESINYNPTYRREVNLDRYRFGAVYKINEFSQFIGSGIISNQSQNYSNNPGNNTQDRDYLAEGLYQGKWEGLNLMLGGSSYEANRGPTTSALAPGSYRRINGYLYSNIRFPTKAVWTFGVNIENDESPILPTSIRINPKIGLTLDFWKNTTIRLAAFSAGNHTLNEYASIEPLKWPDLTRFLMINKEPIFGAMV